MTGAISFREFQRRALYGPDGFYSRGRAGRRGGDFLTSPEVGPLFGAVGARYLDAQWDELGRPDPFTVIEAGAGPGTLARAVLAASPSCRAAMRYVAVEVSDEQRRLHPAGIQSVAELPAGPFDGVVIAERTYADGEGVVLAEIELGRRSPSAAAGTTFWLHRRGALPAAVWHYQRWHGRRWYRRNAVRP